MNKQHVVLCNLLRFGPHFLDDSTLFALLQVCEGFVDKIDLSRYFRRRCLSEGFAVPLDLPFRDDSRKNAIVWPTLFDLNSTCLRQRGKASLKETSVCYVHVGSYLLSVPIEEVPTESVVSKVVSDMRAVVSHPFRLHQMKADGGVGVECEEGQAGTRFVLVFEDELRSSPTLVSPKRGRIASSRGGSQLRSVTMEYPRVPRLSWCAFHHYRSKTQLRDSSDTHVDCRHRMFRSNSSHTVRRAEGRMWRKVCSMYFSSAEGVSGGSSFIFPLHSPNAMVFNTKKLAMQSTPRVSPLDFTETRTLLDIIQRVINTADAASLPLIQQMSTQIGTIAHHYPVRPMLPPLNGHAVNRTMGSTELARYLEPGAVRELLELAESQGVRERPLLVQLRQTQWRRLCPRNFCVASHMLGVTSSGEVPLPEELHAAQKRLVERFTSRLFSSEWVIEVRGATESLPAKSLRIGRSATVRDLLDLLREGNSLSWGENSLDFSKLCNSLEMRMGADLRWCSGESLELTVVEGGVIRVSRNFCVPKMDDPACKLTSTTRTKDNRATSSTLPSMLWDTPQLADWNSTTRRISALAARAGDDCETTGGNSVQRKMVLARAARNGFKSSTAELEDLGVTDLNTEYARWWTEGASLTPDRQEGALSPAVAANEGEIPTDNQLTLLSVSVSEVVSVSSSESVAPSRPLSPVSPVHRERRKIRSDPRVLRSSRDSRQFEFHPVDPDLVLSGSRSGVVALIDASADFAVAQSRVDTSPILGIAWLRSHLNLALYGASSSGLVGMLKMGNIEFSSEIDHQPVGRFQNLSSVSVNCTDDYFLVSGFTRDMSLFDLYSGKRICELKDAHTNFINIVRFSHLNPFLFATSSFDSTCKLWDLRTLAPVASHATPSLNVMCNFSPNDNMLLVSGLDQQVVQLAVNKNLQSTIPNEVMLKSIPPTGSNSNYRRSVYLANGSKFITAGTDENFVKIVNSESGECAGMRSFKDVLRKFEARLSQVRKSPKVDNRFLSLQQSIQEDGTQISSPGEYIQSIRAHPTFKNEIGVLLYPFERSKSSYICTTSMEGYGA